MRTLFVFLSLLLSVSLAWANGKKTCGEIFGRLPETRKISKKEKEFYLNDLKNRSLSYFIKNTHPQTGLVLDRARAFEENPPQNRMASIAATGFGLTIVSHAAHTGTLSKTKAKQMVKNALESAMKMEHFQGWLPHFIDWETRTRIPQSEFSTVDTSLFLAGVLYAERIFNDDPEITGLAKQLLDRIDFRVMLTNGGKYPEKKTFSMGYEAEKQSFTPANWDSYAEHSLLYFLGLGASPPGKAIGLESWKAWQKKMAIDGKPPLFGSDLPLFAHQYPFLWLDPIKADGFPFNPLENGKSATLRDQALSKIAPLLSPYAVWGLSASDSPEGYRAFRFGNNLKDPGDNNGTVCPGCVMASIAFTPDVAIEYLDQLHRSPQKNHIYGRYGFVDAINPTKQWCAEDSLGITVGPVYLSIVNHESKDIWKEFEKSKTIQSARRRIETLVPPSRPTQRIGQESH